MSKVLGAPIGWKGQVMTRTFRTTVTVLALLSLVLLAACGDDDTGLSRMDVEEIVRSELAAVQEQQSATAPPKYMPEEYTKFLVSEAIDRYESGGPDATLPTTTPRKASTVNGTYSSATGMT